MNLERGTRRNVERETVNDDDDYDERRTWNDELDGLGRTKS